MQSVFVIVSAVPGLLYIGGKWASELTPGEPATLPVAPRGPVYIEYRPLLRGYLPMARRLTMSAGRIVKESIAEQPDIGAVQWPSGAIELELTPEAARPARTVTNYTALQGVDFAFTRGDECSMELSRGALRVTHALPPFAQPPEIMFSENRIFLMGPDDAGGKYLLVVSADRFSSLLYVGGDEIQTFENGAVQVFSDLHDTAGHRMNTFYAPAENGYADAAHEILWASGAPNWPQTPEDTALAAAEAIRLGLMEEAENYFVSEYAHTARALTQTIGDCSGVTGMKYGLLSGRSSIGLMTMEAKNLLTVSPLYYTVAAERGLQGTYRLEQLTVD